MRYKPAQLVQLIHFASFEFLVDVLEILRQVQECVRGVSRAISTVVLFMLPVILAVRRLGEVTLLRLLLSRSGIVALLVVVKAV